MTTNDHSSSATVSEARKFWRKAILQRGIHPPNVRVDRYRWALRCEEVARKRHKGKVSFEEMVAEVEIAWQEHGGPPGLSWQQAKAALRNCWERADAMKAEAIAGRAGFKSPPTFSDHGGLVPRNIDEPNM